VEGVESADRFEIGGGPVRSTGRERASVTAVCRPAKAAAPFRRKSGF